MNRNQKIVLSTLVVIGILLISIFAVTTKQEIKEIKEDIEKVEDQPLSVRILADTSSGTSPLTVNFKPLILNSKNEIKYHWDFGDDNTSKAIDPTHIYRKSGIFGCSLTIESGKTILSDSFNVTVFPNNPPEVKILCKTTAFRPEKLFFDAEVFDPEGEELEYHWILKHPLIMGGYEKHDTFDTKNFSKLFWRNGRYVVELIVTDESGNQGHDYEIVHVQVSQLEGLINSLLFMYTVTLPGQIGLFWDILNSNGKVVEFIDNNWFDWPPIMQKIVQFIIKLGGVNYDPPIPKAELQASEIDDINLSTYVNDSTGVVEPGATVSRSFTISNIDTLNTARSIYITLDKPFSDDEGLPDEIEVEEHTVDLDVGAMSNKLFFNGNYTNWENCYNIEKLAPGDLINMGITVALEEGSIFNKGVYPCTLYIYQEKYLDKAEYVDEIPFTIIL